MGSRDLLSKKQFQEFFLPYLEQAVKRMNEFQGATGVHICRHTSDRWGDVVNTGISSFWVDNCESLQLLKEQFGTRIAISGNLPPVDILRNGTEKDIYKGVEACLMAAVDNPCGYTLCPGCTTPVGTTKENMIAFMNAAATYGKGAKKGFMPNGIKQ